MNDTLMYFLQRLEKLQITLSENQLNQFQKFYEILVEQNQYMNLTAITEYEDVLLKHYVDCLAVNVVPVFRKMISEHHVKIIDVGTGAGFPGIPIKITFPEVNIDLLDSLNKRINFLNTVITQTGLENIRTFHGRAEDFANKPEFRQQYDMCVSRAVANLSTLSEYCLPFIKSDGYFIALKSGDIIEELNAAKNAVSILGGFIEEVIPYTLPDSDIERNFVIIKKVKSTLNRYPRKAGLPSKEPLK